VLKRQILITGFCGIAGALLMFSGDMLLYYTLGEYTTSLNIQGYADIMGAIPHLRVILGGMIGPPAAFLYCIGSFQVSIAIGCRIKYPVMVLIPLLLSIVFVGAFHSQFGILGLVASAGSRESVKLIVDYIYYTACIAGIFMSIAYLALGFLILTKRTSYPRWFIVFTPIILIWMPLVLHFLPQPLRIILLGGWNNLLYLIYFTSSTLVLLRKNAVP
jgi:hypothetical protein